MSAKQYLLVALGIITAAFVLYWIADIRRRWTGQSTAPAEDESAASSAKPPGPPHLIIGFVSDFFDTLGISSFATTTAMFRFAKLVPDRIIPGTLNVGHLLPTVVQAFIYMESVQVEPQTLILLILASVAGAWLGAGVVAGWSKRKVQIGMAIALLCASVLMLTKQLNLSVEEGTALGVSGTLLLIAVVGNFILGALMTLGIGLYAPCMIMVSLLGMNPKAAFPIMMGSCAFLMPASSARFIREKSYDVRAALGLTLGGLPAVFLAAFLVKALPLTAVRWLVIVVVVYTAITMLVSALNDARK